MCFLHIILVFLSRGVSNDHVSKRYVHIKFILFQICSNLLYFMLYYKSCRTSSRKEGECSWMKFSSTFLVSVLAGVVSYYICKWLDGRTIDSNSLNGLAHRNEQESPQSCSSGGFRFATWNLTTFLSCYYHMPEQAKCQLNNYYHVKLL